MWWLLRRNKNLETIDDHKDLVWTYNQYKGYSVYNESRYVAPNAC